MTSTGCCPHCGADWWADSTSHLGIDVEGTARGGLQAVLLACCEQARAQVLAHGYASLYGQQLQDTLRDLGCDPAQVATWERAAP